MGCDIHIVAEVRRGRDWHLIPRGLFPASDLERKDQGVETVDWPFNWRSYAMFTLLAGVRDQGVGIEPIDEPRGLPHDLSKEAAELLDWAHMDYHSASWLTLADLMGYRHYGAPAGIWTVQGPDQSVRSEERVTVRDRIGQRFFDQIEILRTLHESRDGVRIAFCFDS